MKLSLAYPVRPLHVNQPFGANPAYYARFHDRFGNPEKGHMGEDLQAAHGQPVYAACDGMAYYEKDDHGGEGIVIRTGPFDYKAGTALFNVINWHLIGNTDPKYPPPFPLDGKQYPVKCGDLIGYADNTGAPFESSGDHLHVGLCPLDQNGNAIEAHNGFNGCIDPAPYFDGSFAEDAQKPAQIAAVQQDVTEVQKAIQNAPTPQTLSYASQALTLISRIIAMIWPFGN